MSTEKCERCDRLEDRISYLERDLHDERSRRADLDKENSKLERKVSELKPYKESADRAYDHYVTTPRGMP